MVEASLYEHLNPLTTVARQRVVENFSGDTLCTDRWTTCCITGANTHRIADVINGGYEMVTSTTIFSNMKIDFNDIRQYSETDSKLIIVLQRITCSIQNNPAIGFIVCNHMYTGGAEGLGMRVCNANTDYQATASTGCGGRAFTATCICIDVIDHTWVIDTNACNFTLSDGGSLVATVSCCLPNENMQPYFGMFAGSAASVTTRIKYLEAYNT